MEQALKQRLVGAGVIVALGVIFIPMFLDGSGEKVVREIPIPPAQTEQAKPGMVKPETIPVPEAIKPEVKPITNDSPPSTGITATGKIAATNPEQKPAGVKTETVTAPPVVAPAKPPVVEEAKKIAAAQKPVTPVTKPTVTAKSVTAAAPKSWVVQVGSFSENSKAIKLRDQLRKKKYRAFVESIATSAGKTLYRVRIGPELKRADAEAVQQKLQKTENIKGFVTHHP